MRERLSKYIILFPLLISVFFLVSCENKKTFKVGVSQCSSDDWRTKMNEEILREARLHPGVEVEIRSAEDSNEKQIKDISYFRDNGFDIILCAPNEAEAVTPAVREAYNSGIPVIVFDRTVADSSYTALIDVDNSRIGAQAARYAAGHLKKDAVKVLEIKGLEGSTPAYQRSLGFNKEAVLQGFEVIGAAEGKWNYEDAAKVVGPLLDKYGAEIDLIFAHNDRMAIAASEEARKRGLDPMVIGVDAAPEIGIKAVKEGVIDATFIYPTEGNLLLTTALQILNNEPFEREMTLPATPAVDSSNAEILLRQYNQLKEESDKIVYLQGIVSDYWDRHEAQRVVIYSIVFVMCMLALLVFVLMRSAWTRRKHQSELMEQNRLLQKERDLQVSLNEQLEAATKSKLVFFTNVSHDLRTPLTLISEPIEQIAKAPNLDERQRSLLEISRRNVLILKRLINQILDFRKYENGQLTLNLHEAEVGPLMQEWVDAFETVARKRNMKLTSEIGLSGDFAMAVDVEKLERIVFNILSNAFKYTPDNGKVDFKAYSDKDNLTLKITDNGRGIPSEDLPFLFDRFFRVDKINPNGSGIGLSLVKAFTELHGGTITAESTPGKGSVFTVKIPIHHVDKRVDEQFTPLITATDIETELGAGQFVGDETTVESGKPILLVIDDNPDVRQLILELLGDDYNIIAAPNGKEGLRLATKYVPDLIICDVMMPVMDGIECTKLIKGEVSTSHIPILMLTACSMDEQRVRGYESGADGYLSKPFNTEVLKSRIKSLLDNRKRIKEYLAGLTEGPLVDEKDTESRQMPGTVGNIDSEFYNKFLKTVREQMADPSLNVDSLASKMGLGRSQFYRKIKALTNYSPVELLRTIRLRTAREMLTSTELSISEIAYAVGFSNPAYFTRCFREVYTETPSELRERLAHKV